MPTVKGNTGYLGVIGVMKNNITNTVNGNHWHTTTMTTTGEPVRGACVRPRTSTTTSAGHAMHTHEWQV